MVRRRSTVRFRNRAPQELTCEARSEAHWTALILRGGWELLPCWKEFGRSPSVRALRVDFWGRPWPASTVPGRSRTRSLPTPSFEHLSSAPGSTPPSGELVTAAVMALTAAPFKQDIDLLIEGLQLAAQRQQAEARPKLAVGLLGVRPWPSPSARPAARPTPGPSGPAPPRIRLTHGPGVPGEDVAVKDRGQVLGLATGPLV
jgi:hypothetical protein